MKTFCPNHASKHRSYTTKEIADLFSVHPNTVRIWVSKENLHTLNGRRPYLIHGTDLRSFLRARQKNRKHKMQPNEIFCCSCKQPQRPKRQEITITPHKKYTHQIWIKGNCDVCGTPMQRVYEATCLDDIVHHFDVDQAGLERMQQYVNLLVNSEIKN